MGLKFKRPSSPFRDTRSDGRSFVIPAVVIAAADHASAAAYGLRVRLLRSRPGMTGERRRARSPLLLCRPGQGPRPLLPFEGSGAPGNAGVCETPWAAGAAARDACEASPSPLRSGEGASRRSTAAVFVRGPVLPGGGRRLWRRLSGGLPPAFSPTASSHRRQPLVVGADGCPRPPGCRLTRPARRRRIRSRHPNVSGRRPSTDRTM